MGSDSGGRSALDLSWFGGGTSTTVAMVGELSRQEARLKIVVAADEADLVSGELWALGTIGIEEQPDGDQVVLLAGFESAVAADAAAAELGRFTVLEEFGSRDYLDGWREFAEVRRAGNRLVIRPPWVGHDTEPVDLVLHIERAAASGQEAIRAPASPWPISRWCWRATNRVLDVGCGSGVLSVAAARLGATDVFGTDIDHDAPRLTLDNARRNGVAEYVDAATTPLAEIAGTFDVVVANMLAGGGAGTRPRPRRQGPPRWSAHRAGLLADQVDDVVAALAPLPAPHDPHLRPRRRHLGQPDLGTH